MTVAKVEVILPEDHSAVMVLQIFARLIVLLNRIHTLVRSDQFEQSGSATPVTRGAKYVVPFGDSRRNIRCGIRNSIVAPKVLAITCTNSDQTTANQLDILLYRRPVAHRD